MSDSPTRTPIAKLEHIRFSYDGGASWVLDDASITIGTGERICLIGPNGSGKSTLARLIAGLIAPDSGTVMLLGHRVFAEAGPDADEYRAARRGIGAVFQNPEDQLVTTVLEDDTAFGPENLGLSRNEIGNRVSSTLMSVDLAARRHDDPTTFSGGQQQRAAIAGMLAMHPRMLVLDEPTAMLDGRSRAGIMDILDQLQERGTTIVHVTHHLDEADHADRVLRLEDGRVVTADAHGAFPAVCEDGSVRDDAQELITARSHRQNTVPGESIGKPDAIDGAQPAICVNHLTYRYPDADHAVIDDLSCTIRRGETVALMGSNGSGKSTLTRLLCALAKPQAGSIEVAGVPVSIDAAAGGTGDAGCPRHRMRYASRRQLADLRHRVGYVMQHPERQLFAETVALDVSYGPINQGLPPDEVRGRVDEALSMLHIGHLAERSPFSLSGGQQRLVAIAGVVACNPEILVMDEPTASLDTRAKARIHDLLRELRKRGVTILMITHDRAEADALADRVMYMPEPSSERITGDDTLPQPNSKASDATMKDGKTRHSNDSLVHRLDPRLKMASFLAVMFSMFAVNSPLQLAVAAAFTMGVIAAARLHPLAVLRSVHPILAMLALMGLLNLFVVRTGSPLLAAGPVTITDDAVRFAVLYTCRFALVIMLGSVFLNTTTPTAITDAFDAALRPLRLVGIHCQEIALVLSLALRFIPTLTDETMAIRDAQAARGGSIETGTFRQKIRAMAAIVVPVFVGALRHAGNLSLALDARCYEEGILRTHWRRLAVGTADIVFAIAALAAIIAIVML